MIHFLFSFCINAIDIYAFLLFVYVIASWFGGLPRNQFGYFVSSLMWQSLKYAKMLPHNFFGLDISVWYVFLFLQGLKTALFILYHNFFL